MRRPQTAGTLQQLARRLVSTTRKSRGDRTWSRTGAGDGLSEESRDQRINQPQRTRLIQVLIQMNERCTCVSFKVTVAVRDALEDLQMDLQGVGTGCETSRGVEGGVGGGTEDGEQGGNCQRQTMARGGNFPSRKFKSTRKQIKTKTKRQTALQNVSMIKTNSLRITYIKLNGKVKIGHF